MNLNHAKEIVKSYKGTRHKFIYKGTRNQVEEFEGEVVDCFHSVFIIKTVNNVIKSFSYNDFIIKNIRIIS